METRLVVTLASFPFVGSRAHDGAANYDDLAHAIGRGPYGTERALVAPESCPRSARWTDNVHGTTHRA